MQRRVRWIRWYFVRALLIGCCILVFGFLVDEARGVIVDASGRARSTVQQTNATTGQTLDSAFEEAPGTTNILPAEALAEIAIVENSSEEGLIRSFAGVNLPNEAGPTTQGDFGVEAAAFSMLIDRGFRARAEASQDRQIIFRSGKLDLPSGAEVRIRSQFVSSAGLILAALEEAMPDALATISLRVQQADDQGPHELLVGTTEVRLGSDGAAVLSRQGAMTNVTPLILDLSEQFEDLQRVHVVLLPLTALTYTYRAHVDQPFSLRAEVIAEVQSETGGQGAVAYLGRPPQSALNILDRVLGNDVGQQVAGEVQDHMPTETGLAASATQIELLDEQHRCGNFGLDLLLGGLLLSAAIIARYR